jgi:excisionase family DNA binding protein
MSTHKSALTVREAADELRCSSATVRRLVHSGALPAVRLGPAPRGQIRIPATSLLTMRGVTSEEVR